MSDPKPKLTESIVTSLLREKHDKPGNGGGGEFAFLAQVRNAAGFNATRTFDGMALSLWPSRGHRIEIFEVKVSRSDWLSELSKPDKAEDACKIADRFWVVAPKGCVRAGELPPTWGLIDVTGDGTDAKPWKLRTQTSAPDLRPGEKRGPLDRGLVVAMLRCTPDAVPGGKVLGPLGQAIEKVREEGIELGRRYGAQEQERQGRRDTEDATAWRELHQALKDHGIQYATSGHLARSLAEVSKQANALTKLGYVRNQMEVAMKALDAVTS